MSYRLIISLTKETYDDYQKHSKDVELRGKSKNFNERYVISRGECELKLGRNGDNFFAEIGEVVEDTSIDRIFNTFNYKRIYPRCKSKKEAKEQANKLKHKDGYVAWEVMRNDVSQR